MPEPSRRHPRRGRRRALKAGAGALAAWALDIRLARAGGILAVRVWPAREYTRVTLELEAPLRHSHVLVADPPRLVVDLEGLVLDDELRELVRRVRPDDPYIAQVRIGQNRPAVVRLVFDLKAPIAPQIFSLAPVAAYRHRLVLDLYPAVPVDPLQVLLEEARRREARPAGPDGSSAGAAPADPIAALLRERETADARAAPEVHDAHDARALRSAAGGSGPAPEPASVRSPARGPKPVERLLTIAIDPGHGGEDPGAIGARGTREKDVVLSIARLLAERLAQEPDMRAFLTRDDDYFVPLAVRVAKARRVQADLFVSIHADAFVERHARGASVFVLAERGASSSAARWLAARENGADRIGGVNLKARNREVAELLVALSTTAQIRDSARLAQGVIAELGAIGRLHKPGVEQAGFAVLRAPDIPSILVETAFISNPDEERRLADRRYQQRIAEAILRGIRRWALRHPPPARSPST